MLFVLFPLLADLPQDFHIPSITTGWDHVLMHMFFENISDTGIEWSSRGLGIYAICDGWRGIGCNKNTIRRIQFVGFVYGDFNLNALPHSTCTLTICLCKQRFIIHTRGLPRNLVKLNLSHNRIRGRPELSYLPSNIRTADLSWNRLTGWIVFTHLPESLHKLDLRNNRIIQGTIFYENLYDRNIQILLWQDQNDPQRKTIQKVECINPEHSVAGKGVFLADVPGKVI